jgi:hypothetical protein
LDGCGLDEQWPGLEKPAELAAGADAGGHSLGDKRCRLWGGSDDGREDVEGPGRVCERLGLVP